jgi:hypothetical protein
MNNKEKTIRTFKRMPKNISTKKLLEALNLMSDINNRIDNFDINTSITSDALLKELIDW